MRLWFMVFIFWMTVAGYSSAQLPAVQDSLAPATDRQALLRLSERFTDRSRRWKEEANLRAARHGWKTREVFPDGTIAELIRIGANGRPLYYITENLTAAKTISTDKLWSGGGLGISVTGLLDTIREWDGGAVLATHVELSGRVTQGDGATSLSDHSTHVAGTMIASGVSANAHGMATQAYLRAFEWTNDFGEMAIEAARGALVSNHSYGYITGWYASGSWYWYGDTAVNRYEDYLFSFYMEEAADVDEIALNAPYYLICKSAGNDRFNGPSTQPVSHYASGNNSAWVPSTTIRQIDGGTVGYDCLGAGFSVSKNILTLGAANDIPNGYSIPSDVVLASFSGTGPADDGRIKPDLVANGVGLTSSLSSGTTAYGSMSGTSMSTPNAAGSLLLLQNYYRSLYGTVMRSATLKGLAIHTADEAGSAAGPDYMYGWGLLNTAKAARTIRQKDAVTKINQLTLANGSAYTLSVTANGSEPLRATICWTDPPGTPPAATLDPLTPMLVNDLDLRIDGTVQPWVLNPASPSSAATTGDNLVDNVEQVHMATPSAGSHTITVTHKGSLQGGSQPFSLIVTGIYTGIADPIPFTATSQCPANIVLNWTKNAASDPVMIAWYTSEAFGNPVNGTSYAAGSTLPGGGTVIYSGSGTSYTHVPFTAGITYYYKAWSVASGNIYSYGRDASAKANSVNAIFPIIEGFNVSTLPDCWSQQASGPVADWTVSGSNNAGGVAYEMKATFQNINPGTTRLKTFALNTTGLYQLNLSFRHMLDDFSPGATLKVQSSMDGTNWTDEAWSVPTGNGNILATTVNTTVVNNLNSETTYIAFVVTGDLYSYDFWYIDNVIIRAPGYWAGGAAGSPTDWNTAANWGDQLVPTASTNVYIPARPSLPVVTNDPASPAQCNNLVVEQGATLTVMPGKKIIVNGNTTLK